MSLLETLSGNEQIQMQYKDDFTIPHCTADQFY